MAVLLLPQERIMLLVAFVSVFLRARACVRACVCVCVCVDTITKKIMDRFSSNFGDYLDIIR